MSNLIVRSPRQSVKLGELDLLFKVTYNVKCKQELLDIENFLLSLLSGIHSFNLVTLVFEMVEGATAMVDWIPVRYYPEHHYLRNSFTSLCKYRL